MKKICAYYERLRCSFARCDDVDIVRTNTSWGNGLHVEDDVWATVVVRIGLVNNQLVRDCVQTNSIVENVWTYVVARKGLVDEQHVWGYVQPEPNQSESIYSAYEPRVHMYKVNYVAMRDPEHEAFVFSSSLALNYVELELMTQYKTKMIRIGS
ncbi:hypothetical protein V6N13_109168 [Hibiscus sabdariffa]|uniref:Uncharacterized protein n=1 Tax=Hibiscus sabdariffa TaxID=183260 RepID=A0ABR2FNV4_9ROSI